MSTQSSTLNYSLYVSSSSTANWNPWLSVTFYIISNVSQSLGLMEVYIWIIYDLLALLYNHINSVFRTYPNEFSMEHWYSNPLTRIYYTTVTSLLIQRVTKTMMLYKAGKRLEKVCLWTFWGGGFNNFLILFITKLFGFQKQQHFNSFYFHVR